MSSLAVIATFFRRPWAVPRIADALRAQWCWPDEVLLMCEEPSDALVVLDSFGEMPSLGQPDEGVNPLSWHINAALDRVASDYIVYLTDDSLPQPEKYARMMLALDENPSWGAVYCKQDFGTAEDPDDWLAGGRRVGIRPVEAEEYSPFCRVDHTQVMHRRTKARWPLDRSTMRLSDAHFFRDLVADLGPLHGIPAVLDWTRQLPDGLSARA